MPVEYFNPLANVSIGKGMDTEMLQREAHTMGELIGLGLRRIGKSTINIDLVPAAVEVTRAADRRKPFLIAAAALLVVGFASWAYFQNKAAEAADDRARTMSEVSEDLTPVESQNRSLLKKEAEFVAIANSYTSLEADHAYWFDLLGELRGAFASDSVWLTEMSPLYSFVPLDADATKGAAKPVVAASFDKKGSSSSIDAPPAAPEQDNSRGRGNNQPEAPAIEANAILIKGFWRENPRSQGVVSDLVKRLRENTQNSSFSFSYQGANGQPAQLSDDQILKVSLTGDEGDLGFPFQLTIPLKRPVSVK